MVAHPSCGRATRTAPSASPAGRSAADVRERLATGLPPCLVLAHERIDRPDRPERIGRAPVVARRACRPDGFLVRAQGARGSFWKNASRPSTSSDRAIIDGSSTRRASPRAAVTRSSASGSPSMVAWKPAPHSAASRSGCRPRGSSPASAAGVRRLPQIGHACTRRTSGRRPVAGRPGGSGHRDPQRRGRARHEGPRPPHRARRAIPSWSPAVSSGPAATARSANHGGAAAGVGGASRSARGAAASSRIARACRTARLAQHEASSVSDWSIARPVRRPPWRLVVHPPTNTASRANRRCSAVVEQVVAPGDRPSRSVCWRAGTARTAVSRGRRSPSRSRIRSGVRRLTAPQRARSRAADRRAARQISGARR